MNCAKCGAALEEGVAFCANCGNRVDGKKACVTCGNMIDENQKFCSRCGTRLDGKTTCKGCGKEFEGNFCPVCGCAKGASAPKTVARPAAPASVAQPVARPAAPAPVPTPVARPTAPTPVPTPVAQPMARPTAPASVPTPVPTPVAQPMAKPTAPTPVPTPVAQPVARPVAPAPAPAPVLVKQPMAKPTAVADKKIKGLRITATTVAFVGAMLAFIFMFFVGFNSEYVGWEGGESEVLSKNVFAFLVDDIKAIQDLVNNKVLYQQYWGNEAWTSDLIACWLEFMIALAMVVLVTVFAILSIVKFVKSFSDKNESATKTSIVVMLVYILGTCLLYNMNMYSWEEDGEIEKFVFNTVTTIGTVVCTIAIVGAFVCKLLENPSAFKVKTFTRTKIVALIGTVMALTAFVIAVNTGMSVTEQYEEYYYGYYYEETIKYTGSILNAGGYADIIGAGIAGQIFMMATIIFLALGLLRHIKNAIGKEYKTGLVWSILALVFSLVTLYFIIGIGIDYKNSFEFEYGYEGTAKLNYVMPIMFAFCALLNMGATIAGRIVSNRNKVQYED